MPAPSGRTTGLRPRSAAAATAASSPRTKRRAAAMSGCAEGPVPATTGARTARSSPTRIHHRNGEPMTRTGATDVRRWAWWPGPAISSCARGGGGPWAGWVRSSSQLSQSGVSAIAEGAGTSRRSARSRTRRYRSGAALSAIATVGVTAGRARTTTRAIIPAASSTRTANTDVAQRAMSQPWPVKWPLDPPASRITAAAAGSIATASARPRIRSTASALARAPWARASTPIPVTPDLTPSPQCRPSWLSWSCSLPHCGTRH